MALVTQTFSDIITFTRASSATYFDATGTLQTATTDVPRFDYDPSTLAAQGLLIEESRTNLCTNSENFTSGQWATNANATKTTGVADPWGGTTAATITATGSSGNMQNSNATAVIGTTYTVSCWMRRRTGTGEVGIRAVENVNTPVTITSTWARYSVTATATQTIGRAGVYVQTIGDEIDIWGFQLEAGSAVFNSGTASGTTTAVVLSAGSATDDVYNGMVLFVNGEYRTITDYVGSTKTATVAALTASPSGAYVIYSTSGSAAFATSYIPTTTSAVTRAADVASVNTLSPWFNAAEGTLYVQFLNGGDTAAQRFAAINDGTSTNTIEIVSSGAGVGPYAFINTSGSGQTPGPSPSIAIAANTQYKAAIAYATDNTAGFRNGVQNVIDTTAVTIPTGLTKLQIGLQTSSTNWSNAWIQRITYYPRRLSQAEGEALTS